MFGAAVGVGLGYHCQWWEETTTENHWIVRHQHQANKYVVGRSWSRPAVGKCTQGSELYPTRVGRALGASGAEKCFNCDFPDALGEWVSPGLKNDLPRVENSDEELGHRPSTRQPPKS